MSKGIWARAVPHGAAELQLGAQVFQAAALLGGQAEVDGVAGELLDFLAQAVDVSGDVFALFEVGVQVAFDHAAPDLLIRHVGEGRPVRGGDPGVAQARQGLPGDSPCGGGRIPGSLPAPVGELVVVALLGAGVFVVDDLGPYVFAFVGGDFGGAADAHGSSVGGPGWDGPPHPLGCGGPSRPGQPPTTHRPTLLAARTAPATK